MHLMTCRGTWARGASKQPSQRYSYIFNAVLSMKIPLKFAEVSSVLLKFYVTYHRCGYQDLLVIGDFDGKDEQTTPAADNPRPGRQAARAYRSQVMNRQVGSRNPFANFDLTEDGERSRGIDQRSH